MSENTAPMPPMQELAEWLRSQSVSLLRTSWSADSRVATTCEKLRRWADAVDAAASPPPPETAAEQAAGLYAAREADIKALLDERAPGTTGNILERVRQLTAWEAKFKAHTAAVEDFLNELYAIMVTPCSVDRIAVKDVQAALLKSALQSREVAASLPIQAVPMQPIVMASDVVRFQKNRLVDALLENSRRHGLGLNELAQIEATPEEHMQLAQLIGYSVDGYGTLSYVTDESFEAANAIAQSLVGGTAQPASEPIPAATAQAEPVPVAVGRITYADTMLGVFWQDAASAVNLPEGTLLYTGPPALKGAVPPTSEQIEALRQWFIRNHKFWLTRDSIRAALEDAGIGGAPSVPDAWRPIESAPKDGAFVLLQCPTHVIKNGIEALPFPGRWMMNKGPWCIFNADMAIQRVEPTHWQPLPPPPQGDPHG